MCGSQMGLSEGHRIPSRNARGLVRDRPRRSPACPFTPHPALVGEHFHGVWFSALLTHQHGCHKPPAPPAQDLKPAGLAQFRVTHLGLLAEEHTVSGPQTAPLEGPTGPRAPGGKGQLRPGLGVVL